MSTRDLLQLQAWATTQAANVDNPKGERRLWRQISREVETYQRGTVLTTPAGAPLCTVCNETGGHHRSLATGRYVTDHVIADGLLW